MYKRQHLSRLSAGQDRLILTTWLPYLTSLPSPQQRNSMSGTRPPTSSRRIPTTSISFSATTSSSLGPNLSNRNSHAKNLKTEFSTSLDLPICLLQKGLKIVCQSHSFCEALQSATTKPFSRPSNGVLAEKFRCISS